MGPFGFRTENLWVTSIDGITPLNTLRNPYPNGFVPSAGASRGLLTQAGANLQAPLQDTPSPWTIQYNVNIQRELWTVPSASGSTGTSTRASTASRQRSPSGTSRTSLRTSAHAVRNFDLSLFKNFGVTPRVTAQFRIEALNAFNRVQFSGPNTSVTSSSFGVISGQANVPRQLQFGLQFLW